MRTHLAKFSFVVLAVALGAVTVTPASASVFANSQPAETETFLFSVQAARGAFTQLPTPGTDGESFRFTLTGLDPVTMFSDRPFRDARLISPKSLDARWEGWFANDPPNAVLTYLRPGKAPASMVVELRNPTYSAKTRSLTFLATREARKHDPVEKGANWERLTTPSDVRSVSLFIDSVPAAPRTPVPPPPSQ